MTKFPIDLCSFWIQFIFKELLNKMQTFWFVTFKFGEYRFLNNNGPTVCKFFLHGEIF